MTYSNARIVRGNDFKLQITVEAPRDYVSGETIWDDFDLTSCSEIHVALICEKDQIVIPLEYEIVPGTTNVLLCPVHGNYLHSGAAYGVEVKGVDGSGYAWRWKAKGKEMFSIVDNTSAQNLDDNLTPENFDINARVGFEIHVDLSDYYTKEQVDAGQAAQDEAIAALDDKVDANEDDIEAKLAAERTRAQGAESTLQDNIDAEETRAEAAEQALSDAIDTLSGSTEGSLVQITARIAAEETRAQATEDDLQDAIDANSGAITAETSRAQGAEQANATAISNEATRAQAAEQANATAISTETSRAQAAESTLQDNIDAEETRAKAAEQANANTIAAEVTRATGAEEANATAISTETSRAQGAEQGLQDQIDALEAAAGGDISGLTQRIAAEETRAQAAEQAIDTDVTALEAAMPLKANSADLATVATSGSYNDLSNKPTIPVVPTNVSAFTNDSGYLVAADIAGKADKADTYTKTEVDEKIDDIIGGEIDLQNYYTKSEVDASQQAQNNEIARKANQSTTYTKTEVDNLLSPKANSADLATVATSGSYNDLTDKPDIPAMQVQSDWNQTGISEPDYIKNKPTIPTVPTDVSAFNNDAGYLVSSDIAGKADKSDTYTKEEVDQIIEEVEAGQGSSLSNYYTKTQIDSQQQVQDAAIANKANSADLATVATSGDYDDLINKPTIPAAQVQSDWGETGTGEPSFIKNKPTNVSAFTNDAGYLTQHQSLDNYYTKTEVDNKDSVLSNAILLRAPQATTYTKTEVDNLVSPKANSADLATVATSGSYNDLSNKPHIPNDQVQADWSQTGTSEPDYIKNKPTNVSAFTNDAGYLTQHQSLDNYYTKAQVDEYENTQNLAILSKAPQATTYTKTEVDNLVSPKANSSELATVATSGSYNDLLNKPHIPNDQVQADWGQTGMTEPDYIKNKPTNVSAFTNDAGYLVSSDIAGKADKSTTYTKTEVDNLVSPKANSADLATVATSGSYNDLSNKPHIPNDQVQADWNQTGINEPDYIKNKPHIPNDQVQADWGETGTGEPSFIKNKPDLSLKQDYEVTVGIQNQSNNYRVRIWEIRNDEVITDVCYKVVNDQTYTCPYTLSYRYDGSDNSWVSQDWTQLTTTYVVIPFSDNANIIELRLSSTGGELYRNIIPANKRVAYTKTEVDNLLSPKANSADLATVATSGSYNDLLNKPHIPNDQVQADWGETGTGEASYIKNKPNLANVATSGSYNDLLNKPTIPTGVTFEVLPTKFADGTIAFDINELHNGKLGESYATEIANCADAEEAAEWWDDNALVELYYSTDNGTTWSNYNMKLYVSPTPGPTKIQLGTNGIWWKLYWYTDLNHEIASDIITGDTDLSNYYTNTEVDNLLSPKANSADLATVATSGSYNDLSNKPSIPKDSNLVHKTGAETIAGNKTFSNNVAINGGKLSVYGSTNLNFSQGTSTSAKPGFTVYNTNSQEVAGFQYRPNTIDTDGLLWLGHYNNTSTLNQTYVGFRNSTSARTGQTTTAAYNLVCPLPVNAQTPFGLTATYQTFYLPLGFTDGTHTVRVPNTGLLNISNIAVTSSSTQGLKIEVVSEMPANPANNTLYVVQ